jgi:hypothetical protein
LEIGFYSIFVLLKGGDVCQVQTDISWEGKVSSWQIITFWDLLQFILHGEENELEMEQTEKKRGQLGSNCDNLQKDMLVWNKLIEKIKRSG